MGSRKQQQKAAKRQKLAAKASAASAASAMPVAAAAAATAAIAAPPPLAVAVPPRPVAIMAPPSLATTILGSVGKLQRAWRKIFQPLTTYRIVKNYFERGPSVEHVKSISFEALVVLLREKPIISASKACLQRIHLLSTFLHGSPSRTLAPENVNVRVFLAGFMIAYRPTHVFESMGALEQGLLEAAIPLIETFERICVALASSGRRCFSAIPRDLTRNFPTLLFEFLKRFKAWKVPDEAKLTCRIKHALIALYQALDHVPLDEPGDSKLRAEFDTQIERLRCKLQQIVGTDALAQFDVERGAPGTGGRGEGGTANNAGGNLGGAYAALPGRMTNEQLAHELLLDPGFQLDENGGCSVENPAFHRIRQSFHQAFWDSLVDDLKLAQPCYARILRVLSEIRDGINDLAGSRESGNIAEIIDLDLIRQQAEQGLYTWASSMRLVGAIVEVVQHIQAPKRDQETKSKWTQIQKSMAEAAPADQPRAFCRAVEFLLDRVNAMRIDAANARLRLIAPVIEHSGIDYERGKLQDKLNDGSLTLERTAKWMHTTLAAELAGLRVPLQAILQGRASAFVNVHSAAMLSLVTSSAAIKTETCPETLFFDVHRICMFQKEFEYLCTAATMLVTVGHSLAATHNSVDQQILATITERFVNEKNRSVDVDLCVHQISLDLKDSTITDDSRDATTRALRQCAQPADAVHMLMTLRVKAMLTSIHRDGAMPTDVQFISIARPLIPRIEKLAIKLRAITNLNRAVHLPHYNRLIGAAAEKLRALGHS